MTRQLSRAPERWTIGDFARAAGASGEDDRPFVGVAIDTREIGPGQVFVALRGERTDGHAFLQAAHDAGAGAALIDDRAATVPAGMRTIVVDDALDALARASGAYRAHLRECGTRVIGVTGSNGKTSTVRLLHAGLRACGFDGTHARKSFNNSIGVPVTVLSARPTDDYLLCEIGTNAPGEIEALTRIVVPDIAAITSIGRAHMEKLGSVAGVAREKSRILVHAHPGGVGVIPAGVGVLERAIEDAHTPRLVRVGVPGDARPDVLINDVRVDASGVSFRALGVSASLPVPAAHMAQNAGVALAIARELGADLQRAAAGLAQAEGEPGRLSAREIGVRGGAATLIDDAYNANPDSVLAALETLAAWSLGSGARRRVAVLGDMFELGEHEAGAHDEVLARALAVADVLIGVGERMASAIERAGQPAIQTCADAAAAGELLSAVARPGDVILLKASRGMGLERVGGAFDDAPA
ncbi:MAG: UDP-N-acetylmuramoyl-tripeptide--D-alanyl-D-alanine ligase [Planctomycetota bacterium]